MASSPLSPVGRAAALAPATLAIALVAGACAGTDDVEPATASSMAVPGPSTDSTAVDQPDPGYVRYVALGDSFAALGPTDAPTSGPGSCLRSTRNYASLLAEREDVGELVDVSCGGAQTSDLTDAQIPETPPQLDALTPDTDLVTLTIGGNDIGFGAIVGCIAQTPRVATGAPCRDRLESQVTGALDTLRVDLDAVYTGIRDRSPSARIVTTAYLPLVPDDGGGAFVSRMSPGDVTWTRHVTERINRVVTGAAEGAGADAVLPAGAAAHSACATQAERYTDFTGTETRSHPMHPTAAGHQAMAEAIAALI